MPRRHSLRPGSCHSADGAAAGCGLLHSHCSLHLHPHCAFHPTHSLHFHSLCGRARAEGAGTSRTARSCRTLDSTRAVPAPPGPKFCLSVSSIGLSIPNVGWGPTNGRRAQLEMEVEVGGQPCPMTKSNFDPHAPKPTPHLGMLADSRHFGRLGLSRK